MLAEDEGDRLVLRPAPDDPIDATFGGLAAEIAAGPALAEVRRDERELEGLDAERRTPR